MSITYEDVLDWVKEFGSIAESQKDYLTQLDAAIGDADHGINMHRGMRSALTKIESLDGGDIGRLLKTVGMALVSSVGGAGGPLYGTLFMQLGGATGGRHELDLETWTAALEGAVKGVQARGKAEPGDKTMIDALAPAVEALKYAQSNGTGMAEALRASAAAAEEGMKATIPLVARKGRASYLGERSAGHQDPGATSSYLLLDAAADLWASKSDVESN
jgi:phosphoenolpyruvate---glycerone phosphotransferase subunit DhaL